MNQGKCIETPDVENTLVCNVKKRYLLLLAQVPPRTWHEKKQKITIINTHLTPQS